MTNATKKPGGWSAVRQQIATWDKPALLALVKDLYDAADVNRDFIQARCQSGENGGEVLEKYRGKIVEQLDELAALLRGEARALYPPFSERLASVEQMTDGIGWGFHDFVADVVGRLEEELGGQ